jgi:hypothetical protein
VTTPEVSYEKLTIERVPLKADAAFWPKQNIGIQTDT